MISKKSNTSKIYIFGNNKLSLQSLIYCEYFVRNNELFAVNMDCNSYYNKLKL